MRSAHLQTRNFLQMKTWIHLSAKRRPVLVSRGTQPAPEPTHRLTASSSVSGDKNTSGSLSGCGNGPDGVIFSMRRPFLVGQESPTLIAPRFKNALLLLRRNENSHMQRLGLHVRAWLPSLVARHSRTDATTRIPARVSNIDQGRSKRRTPIYRVGLTAQTLEGIWVEDGDPRSAA